MKAGVVSLLLILGAVPVQAEKRLIPDFGEIEIVSDPHDPLHFANEWQVNEFVGTEGFGWSRVILRVPGVHGTLNLNWASTWKDDHETTMIESVDLIGLLLEQNPRAYLTDRRLTPDMQSAHDLVVGEDLFDVAGPSYAEKGVANYPIEREQLEDGKWRYFRKLDVFEIIALRELVDGAQVVRWNNGDGRTRAVGALRAMQSCIECHTKAKEGDLLGVFTYHLKREKHTPAESLEIRGYREELTKLLNEGAQPAALWAVLGEPEPSEPKSEDSDFQSFLNSFSSSEHQLGYRLADYGIVSRAMLQRVYQLRKKIVINAGNSEQGTKPRLTYRGAYPRPVAK